MTRRFISVEEFAKNHKQSPATVNYRLSNGHVPDKYLKVIKSRRNNRLVIGIREDAPFGIIKPESTYPESRHTVYLPGGIKKVLEPHEYKNTRWRKVKTVA